MSYKTTQPVKNKACRRRRPINVIPSDFEKDEEIKKSLMKVIRFQHNEML